VAAGREHGTGRLNRREALWRTAGALGGVGLVTLLSACQVPILPSRESDDARPTPTPLPATPLRPTAEAQPAARATPAVAVKRGGALVWAAEADPVDLDPLGSGGAASLAVWADLAYQSLVMFDENLRLTPCLAESWAVVDPTTWTFRLREGVMFHDGNVLDAEDVKVWFDRLTATTTSSPYMRELSRITKVEPTGTHEVQITLTEPFAPLLATLASLRGTAIASRRWLARAGAAIKTSAMGTGPFKIDAYVAGSHVHFVRHRDYWEHGLPYVDEVTLRIIPDEAERAAALRAGTVTYARFTPEAGRQLTSEKQLNVLALPGPLQQVTTFNTRRKPFDDVRIRQAVGLAVDRRSALDRVIAGEGKLTGPVPTGHGNWSIVPEDLKYQRDIKKAMSLLTDAGANDGVEAMLRVSADDPIALALATMMADQVKDAGITLTVDRLSRADHARALQSGDFDAIVHGTGFLPDPDGYFTPYQGGSPQNVSGYSNPHLDDLVDQARGVLDPGTRKRLYDEASTILLSEVPSIWWFTQNNTEVINDNINGYSQSVTGRRIFLKQTGLGNL
jgi:peptide/nickel transport system substrate-binding protein